MNDYELTGTRIEVLRRIPYGIHIITTRDATGLHAATVSWAMQTSFEPTRIAVALRTPSRILQHIAASRVFALNLLARGQEDMAQMFFQYTTAGFEESTCHGFRCRPGETACPLFVEAAAWIECANVQTLDNLGDHTVLVGDVVQAGMRVEAAPPLVLHESPWSYGG